MNALPVVLHQILVILGLSYTRAAVVATGPAFFPVSVIFAGSTPPGIFKLLVALLFAGSFDYTLLESLKLVKLPSQQTAGSPLPAAAKNHGRVTAALSLGATLLCFGVRHVDTAAVLSTNDQPTALTQPAATLVKVVEQPEIRLATYVKLYICTDGWNARTRTCGGAYFFLEGQAAAVSQLLSVVLPPFTVKQRTQVVTVEKHDLALKPSSSPLASKTGKERSDFPALLTEVASDPDPSEEELESPPDLPKSEPNPIFQQKFIFPNCSRLKAVNPNAPCEVNTGATVKGLVSGQQL